MSVHAYHPGTGADVVLTEDQLAHMRISGWVLKSEWDEQQAAAAASQAAAAQASKPSSKSEGK